MRRTMDKNTLVDFRSVVSFLKNLISTGEIIQEVKYALHKKYLESCQ